MGLQDLVITPIYLVLFTILAYILRPLVTNERTRKYFIPALWVRFLGAIALGVLYQFYYGGGDTFSFWAHGSAWVWRALMENPEIGMKMLLNSGGDQLPEFFNYSSRIWYFRDPKSYLVVRIAAICDVFTFHTYSATAIFFALYSFSGLWAMYSAIQQKYDSKYLHFAILFVPSVAFWGSGILKDTITLGSLGWLTWGFFYLLELKRRGLIVLMVILFSTFLIYLVKPYIVVCFIPTVFVWIYLKSHKRVSRTPLKFIAVPFFLLLFGGAAFAASIFVSTSEYNINSFAEKAAITAYDIRYGWGTTAGGDGGYDLGTLDGTLSGTLLLMPAAINVSLFRPYLWEVRNPLMLLSAIESLLVFVLTIKALLSGNVLKIARDPFLSFCVVFAILFAFAVGVSTFNFGTLFRYKIPILSFYLVPLLSVITPSRRKL